MKSVIGIFLWIVVMTVLAPSYVYSQAESEQDTTKAIIQTGDSVKNFTVDTLIKQDNSPLDISKSRGLYILTPDGRMQLRILGSVRFSALYDFVELPIKNTFNTFFIPTGRDNHKLPNYHNSLSFTRMGFEITRKTRKENVFIRIETDFNGPEGTFRLRHAYGQIGKWLLGQTWSLVTNVSDLPATVDPNGPSGSVTLRTPQIRYTSNINDAFYWAVGLEYSQADLNPQDFDTSNLTTVQVIPDFAGRIGFQGQKGTVQFATIITTISIKDVHSKVSNTFGYGGFLSGKIVLARKQQLYYQVTSGKSIAHFITTFIGTGQDAVLDPATNEFVSLYSLGGFLSYGYLWSEDISTHLSFGSANVFNRDFQPGDAYRNSLSASVDAFWRVIKGARVGLNYSFGQRWNKNGSNGQASRIWALFYYDF